MMYGISGRKPNNANDMSVMMPLMRGFEVSFTRPSYSSNMMLMKAGLEVANKETKRLS